jgi:hypothetical protein
MLWNYAPSDVMVGFKPIGGFCGASGRGLQMGGRRWRSPLLRSALARRRKDLYLFILSRSGDIRAGFRGRVAASSEERPGERPRLQRIFHRLTGERADLLRRRCHRRAFESRARTEAQSEHHLALEWQGAGGPAGRSVVSSAAFGSRGIHSRRDHHRSRNERVTEQQHCNFLRAPALRAGTAAQVSQHIAGGCVSVR